MSPQTNCHGCKHLRYAPTHLAEPEHIIPAWSAPGEYRCAKFALAQPATLSPRPIKADCKETS